MEEIPNNHLWSMKAYEQWDILHKETLAGGWATHLKNMLVKLDHLPNNRSKN